MTYKRAEFTIEKTTSLRSTTSWAMLQNFVASPSSYSMLLSCNNEMVILLYINCLKIGKNYLVKNAYLQGVWLISMYVGMYM